MAKVIEVTVRAIQQATNNRELRADSVFMIKDPYRVSVTVIIFYSFVFHPGGDFIAMTFI